jgi:hypothetical protein
MLKCIPCSVVFDAWVSPDAGVFQITLVSNIEPLNDRSAHVSISHHHSLSTIHHLQILTSIQSNLFHPLSNILDSLFISHES